MQSLSVNSDASPETGEILYSKYFVQCFFFKFQTHLRAFPSRSRWLLDLSALVSRAQRRATKNRNRPL